jgi:hypothetical protein
MSSNQILDRLGDTRELVVWSIYDNWHFARPTEKGFRLACVYKKQFFNWNSKDVYQRVHPLYQKCVPGIAAIDTEARQRVLAFLNSSRNLTHQDLLNRATAAQRHWEEVKDMDNPGPRLYELAQEEARKKHRVVVRVVRNERNERNERNDQRNPTPRNTR